MTMAEFEAFIESQAWKFAKSMPNAPHEYVVRGRGNDPAEFQRAVEFIRATGYPYKWQHLANLYVDTATHFYWTMGDPVPDTVIINRAKFTDYPNRIRPLI